MSLAGIQRLNAIVSDVQSRTPTRAELEAHYASLAAYARRDLFNAAPAVGVAPDSESPPWTSGAAPIHAGKGTR